MSDLHLDHEPAASERWLAGLATDALADVVVLAGDCYSTAKSHHALVFVLQQVYPNAEFLLVPGNHDYWQSSPADVELRWKFDFAGESRVHLALEPKRLVIRGVEFFAGTLWYRRPRPGQQQGFVDLTSLKGAEPWVFDQQALFEDRFRLSANENTIVVSHHLPTARSVPPEFRGSPVNHFFMCDMLEAICLRKPTMWLHGHTHTPCDYSVGPTRVVCHPRGYPHEWRGRATYEPRAFELEVA